MLPPNFERIRAAFPNAVRRGVLFAYGEDIYNPSSVPVSRALLAHEYRHCARQFQRVDAWWDKYIEDPEFRYNEELIAHADEFIDLMKGVGDRNKRTKLIMTTAARLIAPLYNYVPQRTLTQATKDLRQLVG